MICKINANYMEEDITEASVGIHPGSHDHAVFPAASSAIIVLVLTNSNDRFFIMAWQTLNGVKDIIPPIL
jgi:hypothetical protein